MLNTGIKLLKTGVKPMQHIFFEPILQSYCATHLTNNH